MSRSGQNSSDGNFVSPSHNPCTHIYHPIAHAGPYNEPNPKKPFF